MPLPFKKPGWENAQVLEKIHWEESKEIFKSKDFGDLLAARASRINSVLKSYANTDFKSI